MAPNKSARRGLAARSESAARRSARRSARLASAAPARPASAALARPASATPAHPPRTTANPPSSNGEEDEDEEEEEEDLTNYHPAQAMPPLAGKPSATITALQLQSAVRRPAQRPNQGALNLSRMGNREAYLAQAVGALAAQPCVLCAKHKGLWVACVVVSGWLNGSCANCHYAAGGSKCSFRIQSK